MEPHLHLRELINRLARLDASSAWAGDLNPTQRAVLEYLGRANRFSRSPSHVAEYLGTTRGTVSQSLKSLLQKGYVSERRSARDKRAISFDLTDKGKHHAQPEGGIGQALKVLDEQDARALEHLLSATLKAALTRNKGRAFGVCRTCVHHSARPDGGFCTLLSEPLAPYDTTRICHEQESA